MAQLIDTDATSRRLRRRGIDVARRRLLITNYLGTDQAKDLSEPPNCGGFGRIRHFRRATSPGWPSNPLPIGPASDALGLPIADLLRAQVFQNAVCNWRCWYCYVPFGLLSANPEHSAWLSAEDLLDHYFEQPNPPPVIDLTGGQPDLTPEWIPWMMAALTARGVEQATYLWSDDNLSNDYFWRYLSNADIDLVIRYPNYGRVGCFKGFDNDSFSFNTGAAPELFGRQFDLLKRFLDIGIDIYAYATFTCASTEAIGDRMSAFVDRLQRLDEHLPLRTVPLEIQVFSPVQSRLTGDKGDALRHQWVAIEAWNKELERRFSAAERGTSITGVRLRRPN